MKKKKWGWVCLMNYSIYYCTLTQPLQKYGIIWWINGKCLFLWVPTLIDCKIIQINGSKKKKT